MSPPSANLTALIGNVTSHYGESALCASAKNAPCAYYRLLFVCVCVSSSARAAFRCRSIRPPLVCVSSGYNCRGILWWTPSMPAINSLTAVRSGGGGLGLLEQKICILIKVPKRVRCAQMLNIANAERPAYGAGGGGHR